jgi:hypothetical protein
MPEGFGREKIKEKCLVKVTKGEVWVKQTTDQKPVQIKGQMEVNGGAEILWLQDCVYSKE